MKLKWLRSYETIKFNTPDGDIHKDQFAIHDGRFIIRKFPENNNNFSMTDDPEEIRGKTLIGVIPGERMYYDEFELPGGRIYRVASDQSKYMNLRVKDAGPVEREVKNSDVNEISKDDKLWQ